jgi:hypothetical protein
MIGDAIQLMFPNAVIIGNYERPHKLDCFEVYVNALGYKKKRDNTGKYFIYKKS